MPLLSTLLSFSLSPVTNHLPSTARSPTILCYMPISSRLMFFQYLNTVQQFFPLAPTRLLQPNLKNLFVFFLLKFTNVAT
uniref:Uncharacterized protein n=1 Tax=Caenorhabditis japonica TaxID=281687 RepID=A0A8R1IYP8_CAEJA